MWALARFCAPWVPNAGEKEKNALSREHKALGMWSFGTRGRSWQPAKAFFPLSPGNCLWCKKRAKAHTLRRAAIAGFLIDVLPASSLAKGAEGVKARRRHGARRSRPRRDSERRGDSEKQGDYAVRHDSRPVRTLGWVCCATSGIGDLASDAFEPGHGLARIRKRSHVGQGSLYRLAAMVPCGVGVRARGRGESQTSS